MSKQLIAELENYANDIDGRFPVPIKEAQLARRAAAVIASMRETIRYYNPDDAVLDDEQPPLPQDEVQRRYEALLPLLKNET